MQKLKQKNTPKPVEAMKIAKLAPALQSKPVKGLKKYYLRVEKGPFTGVLYPISGPRVLIGRRVDAQIPIFDFSVSRDHALVQVKKNKVYIQDLKSSNGTKVNGDKANESMRLRVGDELSLGDTHFVLLCEGETFNPTLKKQQSKESSTTDSKSMKQQYSVGLTRVEMTPLIVAKDRALLKNKESFIKKGTVGFWIMAAAVLVAAVLII